MHSGPTTQGFFPENDGFPLGPLVCTKGGVFKFDLEIIKTYIENKSQVFDANAVQYRINKNREGYIGWLGYTGSVLQWHLDQKISFAYVPAESNFIDFYAQRAGVLQKLVLQCSRNEKTDWEFGDPNAGGC